MSGYATLTRPTGLQNTTIFGFRLRRPDAGIKPLCAAASGKVLIHQLNDKSRMKRSVSRPVLCEPQGAVPCAIRFLFLPQTDNPFVFPCSLGSDMQHPEIHCIKLALSYRDAKYI